MRHHEKGAAAVFKMAFQKLDGVDVQVVRGLVHDVEVGLAGQHPGKCHPLHFPAGEFLHRFIRVREAELREKLRDPQFVLPQMVRIQLSGPFRRAVHNLAEKGLLRIILVLLFQKSDADILEEQHLAAAVGSIGSGQDPQQRGLARPIGGDERHLVAFIDIEADIAEQHFGAVTLGNVLDLQVTCHGKANLLIIFGFSPAGRAMRSEMPASIFVNFMIISLVRFPKDKAFLPLNQTQPGSPLRGDSACFCPGHRRFRPPAGHFGSLLPRKVSGFLR